MSTLAVDAIQNAAGTSAATIGTNGEISTAHNLTSSGVITGNYLIDDNYPIFSLQGISGYQSAAYEGVGGNIVCPSGYSTTHINQGGLMGSDGAIVAPATGIYEWNVWTGATTNGNSGHRGMYIYHKSAGGTANIQVHWTHNTYGHWDLMSHMIYPLAQGDKILWGYHNAYQAWHQGTDYFFCWGRRLK